MGKDTSIRRLNHGADLVKGISGEHYFVRDTVPVNDCVATLACLYFIKKVQVAGDHLMRRVITVEVQIQVFLFDRRDG